MTSGKGEIENYKLPVRRHYITLMFPNPTDSVNLNKTQKDKFLKSNFFQKEEDRFHKTFIHPVGTFLFLSKFVPSN